MKLTWMECNCGSPICDRKWPLEIGTYYQGSGFSNLEREVMDKAFSSMTKEQFHKILDKTI